MKKYALTFIISSLSAVLLYALNFHSAIKFLAFGSLVLSLILSGTLVSGDRMRANSQHEHTYSKTQYLYVLVFALPFLILLFLTKNL